ncbi:MAG: hypothetical protein AMXMBFR64_56850 [Myxococcales bacterium]
MELLVEPPVPSFETSHPDVGRADVLHWTWLGRIAYADAARLQEHARESLLAGRGPERLLLLEHPPTITIGRNGDRAGLLASDKDLARQGIVVEQSTRGGHLTWHAPGQLVAWPVLCLRRRRLGPREHVMRLASGIAAWLREIGVLARWSDAEPGVWTDGSLPRKVASVGVHVHRDVTAHGAAVNLSVDLRGFAHIRPCGLAADVMTSVERELGHAPEVEAAASGVAAAIAAAYGMAAFEIASGAWAALGSLEDGAPVVFAP